MTEELKPQVGDVWAFEDHDMSIRELLTIKYVGENLLIYTLGPGEEHCMNISKLEKKAYSIVERDGKSYKPPRVFEDGAFYPVLYGTTRLILQYCSTSQGFHTHNDYTCYEEDDMNWIGDKIEGLWPEEESEGTHKILKDFNLNGVKYRKEDELTRAKAEIERLQIGILKVLNGNWAIMTKCNSFPEYLEGILNNTPEEFKI